MIRLQMPDIRYQTLYVRYKDRIDKGETIFHMGYSVIIQIKQAVSNGNSLFYYKNSCVYRI